MLYTTITLHKYSQPCKQYKILKSICVEFNPGSLVNYGFIYALCDGQVCLGLLHGKC